LPLPLPICAAVVGMGSLEQLRLNVAAASTKLPLNPEERKALEKDLATKETAKEPQEQRQ
jgi:aryl-alcohol dehydrogenase-like predicted oxidoreductase